MNKQDILGKRVKVIRGTRDERCVDRNGQWRPATENSKRFDYQIWCAGNVPVGSTGTIIEIPDKEGDLCQIIWDHDQEPGPGYLFGVDPRSFRPYDEFPGLELMEG